jgi:uncharacterized protein (DUF302 family)
MAEYGFTKQFDGPFDQVLEKTQEELKKEGFGVLTSIDVQAKLKEKLDMDFPRYLILGACNPAYAHKALQEEELIGLLLPCNVVVFEKGEKTVVSVIRPTEAMKVADNPKLEPLAREVEEKLRKAFEAL